jgi:hypothetical protein
MKTCATLLLALLLGLPPAGNAFALDQAYFTLLDSDMGKMKRTLITANLKLGAEEGALFWPVYEEYERDLARINQSRRELLQEYKAVAGALSDEIAGAMVLQFLDLEEKETELKRKYYKKVEEKVSPRVAARLFPVDNQINLMLHLELAASKLPIVR